MLFRPQNKEELFNLRHAQLRNVIERIFGVLKAEFKMAREASDYPIQIQCLIPLALCVLHNYLRIYDPDRNRQEFTPHRVRDDVHGLSASTFQEDQHASNFNFTVGSEDERCAARRNAIATAMWVQYQEEVERRRSRLDVS